MNGCIAKGVMVSEGRAFNPLPDERLGDGFIG